MASRSLRLLVGIGAVALSTGCGDAGSGASSQEDDFTSATAKLVEMDFDGELLAATSANPTGSIRAQLLYTVGHFNGEDGVSRLQKAAFSNVSVTSASGGLYRIRYHAKLPVAWNTKRSTPKTYTITLPKRVDETGQAAFLQKYSPSCTDGEGHGVNVQNLWYHYRPSASGCSLAAADVTVSKATVRVSAENTSDKYPEYHRVWEDGFLDIVAVFGKYEDGATTSADAGVAAYEEFLRAVRDELPGVATTPIDLPDEPGAAYPDVTLESQLDDGRTVRITALLVDRVSAAPPSFDARFAELTPGADLVLYDGHAGLGANVRALSKKVRFFPRKYQLFFMNGCDTLAYEDDSLVKAKAALSSDDAKGTKYLDIMMNAMPAYFSSMPYASMAVIGALVHDAQPRTYQRIFLDIDDAQTVVVTGEEDNVFTPSFDPGERWEGLEESGSVGYKESEPHETDLLPAGTYVFEMTPEPTSPGGDADLHLAVGKAPSLTADYKCPSYKYNSNERCFVTLKQAAKVFWSATGDKKNVDSAFLVRAWQRYP